MNGWTSLSNLAPIEDNRRHLELKNKSEAECENWILNKAKNLEYEDSIQRTE